MTDSNGNDDIRDLVSQLARSQLQTQEQIRDTQEQLRGLTNDIGRVLARAAIYDDVVLELRENQQMMQANFNEHQRTLEEYRRDFLENQRTTNAALNSLEAINLRLIEIIGRGQN
jgi:predicted  nucleic acid-binding Zn-ribbon protein